MLRHIYNIYKPLNTYDMRKLIVVALMLVGTLTYANDSSKKERKIIYDFIHLQLQQGEITLIEAQHLWRKYVITK